MTVKLDKHFEITSDGTSFSLMYTPKKQKDAVKEPSPRALGHYGDLRGALVGYLKNNLRNDTGVYDIKEVLALIDKVENNIKKALHDK